VARLTFSLRRKWRNHTGNQGIDPLRIVAPSSLEEVIQIVREAERAGCTVRALGSGHSWSDVALTRGFALLPTGLARALELERDLLRPDVAHPQAGDGSPGDGQDPPGDGQELLVRVQGGMRIRELNAHLDSLGWALPNMGGYDGQTVAGVMATATHGSGIGFGPIADDTRSLDVVASGGELYRIEPADGITDPGAFAARHPGWSLLQDDNTFNAARVAWVALG
jgi:L-gulono-1,4-lactone dehydrogenase